MKHALIDKPPGGRSWMLVFAPGEEAVEGLTAFARGERLAGGWFTALGAFERATLAFFDLASRSYEEIPVDEQVEVASLVGNLAHLEDGGFRVHAHAVLGRRDGGALAGHLVAGTVRPTLELVLVEAPRGLSRRADGASGLPLLLP